MNIKNIITKQGIIDADYIKRYVVANLGKSFIYPMGFCQFETEVMIVGYNEFSIVVSATNKSGWSLDKNGLLYDEDYPGTILLNSPLNVSFWHIYWKDVVEKMR